MKRIIVLSFVLLGTLTFAQNGKLRKADRYYEKLSYAYAVPLYEQLLGSEIENPLMKANLARSYYFMGNMEKAEPALAAIVNSAIAKEDDLFYYAQALKQNGKIAESDAWMNKFRNKAPGDIRGNSYSQNADYFQRIMAQSKKFEIKNLMINTSSADFGGYPAPEGNEAYFVSNRKKRAFIKNEWSWNKGRFLDLYSSTIGSFGELEDADMLSRKTNSKYHEGPIAFTPDGKTVYFTRNNIEGGKERRDDNGIQNLKLYRATVDEKGNWINEEVLPFNSKDYSVGHPTISADGKWMYFASDMPGGIGGADIYKVELLADGKFGKLLNLGKEINTEGQDMFPWISQEGNLFFSSDGRIGLGGLDVFVLFPTESGFAGMKNLGLPINGQHDDFAFIMNKDNTTGYFSSNRPGGKGDDDIYSFRLIEPLKLKLNLEGWITDQTTKLIIPNASVDLIDEEGNIIASTFADAQGKYSFGLEPDKVYKVKAYKEKYYENNLSFTTKDLTPGTELLKKNLQLEQDPGLGLYALVTDGKTGAPIEGVRLSITDNLTGLKFLEVQTPASGDALKSILNHSIGDRVSYNVDLLKDGYFPKTITFNSKISKPGIISIHEMLEGGLTMDKEVKDLSELIQINPINFDLNKSTIRPDAKIELDKIVEIMNKYPELEVELGSHTDCRASKAYNEKLSDRRAKASAAYIKSKITNPERIYGKGYGESRLLNGCECEGNVKSDCSEEEHEKNRRTEFKVIKTGSENIKVINNSTDSFGN
jgi:outer membrane protein OmpA-like peptidoglycan-associated protein